MATTELKWVNSRMLLQKEERIPFELVRFWLADRTTQTRVSPVRLTSLWLKKVGGEATLTAMSKATATVTQETDEELAAVATRRDGDFALVDQAKRAFSLLYARHSRLLRAFISTRAPRSELDDVEQAVWEKIWVRLPDQFQGGNFRAWLYQIARNHLVDHWRKIRPSELPESFDVHDQEAQAPYAAMLERERMELLERCLGKLGEPMSVVVRGRLSGESYESLCESLQIDNAKAQKLLFSAKQLLQTCVEGGRQ